MDKLKIAAGLKDVGLKKGDVILLHSALSSLGHVKGGADTVIDAFLDVLGPKGTLVVPIFGDLGIITTKVQERPEAVESVHPAAAVAAIGAKADEICRDHWKAATSHGVDTPYMRIAEMGGYVLLLGVDQDRNTSLHSAEALECMPYLKTITAAFEGPDGETEGSWDYFPGPHRDFIGLDPHLRQKGIMKVGKVGTAMTRLMKSKDMIDEVRAMLRRDPAAVLCDNPNCADCVRQRAAIDRDRFNREEFILAVSGSLAGPYVPEMIDNLRACGLDFVELDFISGKEVTDIPADKLRQYCEELKAGGITVTGFRSSRIARKVVNLVKKAQECGVGKVVMPLAQDVRSFLDAGKEAGVHVLFENTALSGDVVSEIMLGLDERVLAFNPANFAFAGEKPFSKTIKKPLKRSIAQLYVNDGTFSRTHTRLAQGNAEIKELVSILRCKSFAGDLVLDSSLGSTGDLRTAVTDFQDRILKSI
jgi:aminoglycoside 3-N-acetyltransferase